MLVRGRECVCVYVCIVDHLSHLVKMLNRRMYPRRRTRFVFCTVLNWRRASHEGKWPMLAFARPICDYAAHDCHHAEPGIVSKASDCWGRSEFWQPHQTRSPTQASVKHVPVPLPPADMLWLRHPAHLCILYCFYYYVLSDNQRTLQEVSSFPLGKGFANKNGCWGRHGEVNTNTCLKYLLVSGC